MMPHITNLTPFQNGTSQRQVGHTSLICSRDIPGFLLDNVKVNPQSYRALLLGDLCCFSVYFHVYVIELFIASRSYEITEWERA